MKKIYLTIIILFATLLLYGQEPLPTPATSTDLIPCGALPLVKPVIPVIEGEQPSNIDKDRLWRIGQTITVRFFGGTNELKTKIRKGAKEWQQYANITFLFVEDGQADIRIGFRKEFNNSSQIGTEAADIDSNKNTMNFSLTNEEDAYKEWVIRHEFGHALGLLHEHVHPANKIPWNRDSVYAHQKHLSREIVDLIFFDLPKKDEVYFCDYDRYSVMHYPIGNNDTNGDFYIGYNQISVEDQRFIEKLYPFSGPRNREDYCANASTSTDKQLRIIINGQGSVAIRNAQTQNTQCSTTCENTYTEGTRVLLEATPNPGYRFVQWQGGSCPSGTNSVCSVILTNDIFLTAIFEPIPIINTTKEVGIQIIGKGWVILLADKVDYCEGNCTFNYDTNATIELQALPSTGYRFVAWGGTYCTDNQDSNCQFDLNTDGAIIAIFESINGENENDSTDEGLACLPFTAIPSNSSCDEGRVTIDISEGVAPFHIVLDGATSDELNTNYRAFRLGRLRPGSHTINIEDNMGCGTTKTFSIENTCLNTNTASSSRSASPVIEEWIISEEKSITTEVPLAVGSNTPNPFRDYTKLPFILAKDGAVSLEIFYSNGQRVYESTQVFEAGKHQIELGGDILPKSALYIYHLRAADQLVTGKMIRL